MIFFLRKIIHRKVIHVFFLLLLLLLAFFVIFAEDHGLFLRSGGLLPFLRDVTISPLLGQMLFRLITSSTKGF